MVETSTVLRWSAFEHEHIERGVDWYWSLGIVAVSIAVTSIILHNSLFAVLILVAALTLGLLANTPPDIATFEISDRGIRINGILHRYDDIISFWVEDEHHDGRPLLLVNTTKFLAPNLIIPIEHIDPHMVRAYLLERSTEVPMREPVAHKILEFLGL
jgi:hypothetical protein